MLIVHRGSELFEIDETAPRSTSYTDPLIIKDALSFILDLPILCADADPTAAGDLCKDGNRPYFSKKEIVDTQFPSCQGYNW